jgi:hypothetical protein
MFKAFGFMVIGTKLSIQQDSIQKESGYAGFGIRIKSSQEYAKSAAKSYR